MLRWLQKSPRTLERVYQSTYRVLKPFRRWLAPGSRLEGLFIQAERLGKGAIFDCRMCGQCILHSTGMTCPMTCPKNLRNGPCGGVLSNGNCEILPEQACVWVQAWERSKQMRVYGPEILIVQPPTNHALKDSSSWVNDLHRRADMSPPGWQAQPAEAGERAPRVQTL
jgi:hypothetical protein